MPQNRYEITKSDYPFAKQYLSRKFNEDLNWFYESPLEDPTAFTDARSEFWAIKKPQELNDWCEEWISRRQWIQLQTAIRAARKRKKDMKSPDGGNKHIALSRKAWSVLSDLAKRDGITISEFIITRHVSEWMEID